MRGMLNLYCGETGSGHYVKMIHNGIEYALLQAYAEGFHMLQAGQYKNLDLYKIAKTWSAGSIIRSWILKLTGDILASNKDFNDISGAIEENLTGRWTLEEGRRANIPLKTLEQALFIRSWSRETGGNYATKLVALLRNAFGGHKIEKRNSNKKIF